MAANKERFIQCTMFWGLLVIFSCYFYHPMFYRPLILSCHYFIFFGKAAFWLHTKTRLRFVLGGLGRGCIIFCWVLLLIMP
ncbi:hypothetical protein HDV63DRAFT_136976 [Trichoderma sp. SZMC 28014]